MTSQAETQKQIHKEQENDKDKREEIQTQPLKKKIRKKPNQQSTKRNVKIKTSNPETKEKVINYESELKE